LSEVSPTWAGIDDYIRNPIEARKDAGAIRILKQAFEGQKNKIRA
jgi:hypothetical protein